MKFILVLFALVAAVAASYGSNAGYDTAAAPLPYPGHNRVYDEFGHPRHRDHHRRRGRHGRHHKFSSSSSDSDSYERGYVFLPPVSGPSYGGNVAQDSNNYGSMSNDAPAQDTYGAPAQSPPQSGY